MKVDISKSEFDVMKVLWEKNVPMTVQDICDELVDKEWKYSTVATLLRRMVDKGAIIGTKKGYLYYYSPLLGENEYKSSQTQNLVSKLYGGSVKNLVVSLFDDHKLSKDDISEIKKLFDL